MSIRLWRCDSEVSCLPCPDCDFLAIAKEYGFSDPNWDGVTRTLVILPLAYNNTIMDEHFLPHITSASLTYKDALGTTQVLGGTDVAGGDHLCWKKDDRTYADDGENLIVFPIEGIITDYVSFTVTLVGGSTATIWCYTGEQIAELTNPAILCMPKPVGTLTDYCSYTIAPECPIVVNGFPLETVQYGTANPDPPNPERILALIDDATLMTKLIEAGISGDIDSIIIHTDAADYDTIFAEKICFINDGKEINVWYADIVVFETIQSYTVRINGTDYLIEMATTCGGPYTFESPNLDNNDSCSYLVTSDPCPGGRIVMYVATDKDASSGIQYLSWNRAWILHNEVQSWADEQGYGKTVSSVRLTGSTFPSKTKIFVPGTGVLGEGYYSYMGAYGFTPPSYVTIKFTDNTTINIDYATSICTTNSKYKVSYKLGYCYAQSIPLTESPPTTVSVTSYEATTSVLNQWSPKYIIKVNTTVDGYNGSYYSNRYAACADWSSGWQTTNIYGLLASAQSLAPIMYVNIGSAYYFPGCGFNTTTELHTVNRFTSESNNATYKFGWTGRDYVWPKHSLGSCKSGQSEPRYETCITPPGECTNSITGWYGWDYGADDNNYTSYFKYIPEDVEIPLDYTLLLDGATADYSYMLTWKANGGGPVVTGSTHYTTEEPCWSTTNSGSCYGYWYNYSWRTHTENTSYQTISGRFNFKFSGRRYYYFEGVCSPWQGRVTEYVDAYYGVSNTPWRFSSDAV